MYVVQYLVQIVKHDIPLHKPTTLWCGLARALQNDPRSEPAFEGHGLTTGDGKKAWYCVECYHAVRISYCCCGRLGQQLTRLVILGLYLNLCWAQHFRGTAAPVQREAQNFQSLMLPAPLHFFTPFFPPPSPLFPFSQPLYFFYHLPACCCSVKPIPPFLNHPRQKTSSQHPPTEHYSSPAVVCM